jgi:hypothetical protein
VKPAGKIFFPENLESPSDFENKLSGLMARNEGGK